MPRSPGPLKSHRYVEWYLRGQVLQVRGHYGVRYTASIGISQNNPIGNNTADVVLRLLYSRGAVAFWKVWYTGGYHVTDPITPCEPSLKFLISIFFRNILDNIYVQGVRSRTVNCGHLTSMSGLGAHTLGYTLWWCSSRCAAPVHVLHIECTGASVAAAPKICYCNAARCKHLICPYNVLLLLCIWKHFKNILLICA